MLQLFKKRMSNRKGFTLVELLVVVAIIGILAAIAIPRFTDATAQANGAKVQADLRTIDSAIMIYYATNKDYPADIAALVPNYLAAAPASPTGTIKIGTATITAGVYALTADKSRATYNGKKLEELVPPPATPTTPTP